MATFLFGKSVNYFSMKIKDAQKLKKWNSSKVAVAYFFIKKSKFSSYFKVKKNIKKQPF